MKKLLSVTSMTTLAALSMSTLTFATSPQNPADLNTATAVTPSIVIDETTSEELVPIRSVGEEYGFDVDYHDATKMTTLTKNDREYGAEIGSSLYEINHDIIGLGTNAQLIDGSTYVPVSFAYAVAEDMENAEITDGGNSSNGGNGGGYGGGDTGTTTDNDFDFNNPDIDNGYTIDENAGFDFENPDIDNGYTLDENAGFDYENPDIDSDYSVDVL